MAPRVFRFRNRTPEEPRIEGKEIYLRNPVLSDFAEWSQLRAASRAFLEPWEPRWADEDLTQSAFRNRIRRYDTDRAAGAALPLFVCLKANDRMVGGVTLGSIKRGVAESCSFGYWMGEQHAGKGLMSDALKALIPHVFDRMQLHRIEAACIPNNARSKRLLEKVGFQHEGYLKGYLKINGAWRDHLLYALIAEDWQSKRAEGPGCGE